MKNVRKILYLYDHKRTTIKHLFSANLAGIAEPDSVEWGNVLKIQKAEQKLRKGTPLKPESQVIKVV